MAHWIVHAIRKAFVLFFRLTLSIYFKEIQIIGIEKVPKEGPIIFVGNHANQYIDPMSICAFSPHEICFLVAASTARQKMMGFFTRLFGGIPVERPQDIANIGKGEIEFCEVNQKEGFCTIIGHDTQFTKQGYEGDTLQIKDLPDYVISEIVSDTEMKVRAKDRLKCEAGKRFNYKIAPKVDQSHVFNSVYDALKKGKNIGIFPEGGSHDQTDLLPLKVGVAIMALGAMSKYKDTKIKVVACGLKYFHPHRFRSKMIIEFSNPFTVDTSLVEEYEVNKRTACSKLLSQIESKLRSVTFSAPSFRELRAIYLARKLYLPSTEEKDYSEEDINELYKRFFRGYKQCRSEPEVQGMLKEVFDYGRELKSLGIRDSQVFEVNFNKFDIIRKIMISTFRLFMSLIFVFPGLLTLAPLAITNAILAEKERVKALKKSNVKVVGADVMGSTKIMTTFILYPLTCVFWTLFMFFIQIYFSSLEFSEIISNCIWFIFFFPIYNYICIRSLDGVFDNFSNLSIRIYLLFGDDTMMNIREKRSILAKRVHHIINKYGPEVFKDFDKMKLVRNLKKKPSRKDSGNDSDDSSSFMSSFMIDEIDFDEAFNSLSEIGI